MATAFKSIFDVAEEKAEKKGMEKGMALAEALVKQREQELKRQTIIRLIKTTQFENIQIAEIVDAPITFVESVKLELKKAK